MADSLRQLVHELRTPANAIAGFAELIETELLGAVPEPYRTRAAAIRLRAGDLIGAIDDLDTAARIDARALALRPVDVPGAPMLERIVADLAPLAALRGAQVTLTTDPAVIHADDRAVERLLGRLLSAVVSAAAKGEAIGVALSPDESGRVLITVDRPAALVAEGEDALPSVNAESEAEAGAPLLGTGFALRLAQNLAVELGGSLALTPLHLRVLLPGAEGDAISRASSP